MEAEKVSDTEYSYPTDYFNDQWKFWIWDNIVRVGCRKETIVEILLKKNFSYDLINKELFYDKYLVKQPEQLIETTDSDIDLNEKYTNHLEIIKEENDEQEEEIMTD